MQSVEKEKSRSQDQFSKDFAIRLRELRNKKKVSAREMSISLGQNVNYINLIENEKRMPSMQGFFLICEYLDTTPAEFFKTSDIKISREQITKVISSLSLRQAECIVNMISELRN